MQLLRLEGDLGGGEGAPPERPLPLGPRAPCWLPTWPGLCWGPGEGAAGGAPVRGGSSPLAQVPMASPPTTQEGQPATELC